MNGMKNIKKNVLEAMKEVKVQHLDDYEIGLIIGGIAIGVEETLRSLVGSYKQDLVEEIINELELKYVRED